MNSFGMVIRYPVPVTGSMDYQNEGLFYCVRKTTMPIWHSRISDEHAIMTTKGTETIKADLERFRGRRQASEKNPEHTLKALHEVVWGLIQNRAARKGNWHRLPWAAPYNAILLGTFFPGSRSKSPNSTSKTDFRHSRAKETANLPTDTGDRGDKFIFAHTGVHRHRISRYAPSPEVNDKGGSPLKQSLEIEYREKNKSAETTAKKSVL